MPITTPPSGEGTPEEITPPVPTAESLETCEWCGEENVRCEEHANSIICLECESEFVRICQDCDREVHSDDAYYICGHDGRVCGSCYESNYFECQDCHDSFHVDEMNSEISEEEDACVCNHCAESDRRNRRRKKEIKSEEKGDIIKSLRPFGVELECVFNRTDSISKAKKECPDWLYSDDGSIRRSKDAVGTSELISPILGGKEGEKEVKKLCTITNKVGFSVNSSCGFHAHLDAKDYKRNPEDDKAEESSQVPAEKVYYIFDSPSYGKNASSEYKKDIPSDAKNIRTEVREVNNKLIVNRGDNFYHLRDLWYVYVAFDDVFRGMQPQSRRSNRFCKATSSLYSLEGIRNLEHFGELECLWYKIDGRRRIDDRLNMADSRKYSKDGSRYVGFNLEPLLRHNSQTIEFRHHSPTLNSEKILRWVDIHQTIMDYVKNNPFPEETINQIISDEIHLIRKAQAMCKLFNIRKETAEYITERIHKFNKLKTVTEDEEVIESDLGVPHSRNNEMERMSRPRREIDLVSYYSDRPAFAIADDVVETDMSELDTRISHLERLETDAIEHGNTFMAISITNQLRNLQRQRDGVRLTELN